MQLTQQARMRLTWRTYTTKKKALGGRGVTCTTYTTRRMPEGWQPGTTHTTKKKARRVTKTYNLHYKEESKEGDKHVQLTQQGRMSGRWHVQLTPQGRKPGGWQRHTTYTTKKKARRVTNMHNLHNKEESQDGENYIQLTQQGRKPDGWQTRTTYTTRKKARRVTNTYNLHHKEECLLDDKHVQLTQQGRRPGGRSWQPWWRRNLGRSAVSLDRRCWTAVQPALQQDSLMPPSG